MIRVDERVTGDARLKAGEKGGIWNNSKTGMADDAVLGGTQYGNGRICVRCEPESVVCCLKAPILRLDTITFITA